MRIILITAVGWALSCGFAAAQTDPKDMTTGRSAPEEKGQLQPQGWTGPLDTKSGRAAGKPARSKPPGMQAAPDGSTKVVTEPRK